LYEVSAGASPAEIVSTSDAQQSLPIGLRIDAEIAASCTDKTLLGCNVGIMQSRLALAQNEAKFVTPNTGPPTYSA
jgi:hypothetical protein